MKVKGNAIGIGSQQICKIQATSCLYCHISKGWNVAGNVDERIALKATVLNVNGAREPPGRVKVMVESVKLMLL